MGAPNLSIDIDKSVNGDAWLFCGSVTSRSWRRGIKQRGGSEMDRIIASGTDCSCCTMLPAWRWVVRAVHRSQSSRFEILQAGLNQYNNQMQATATFRPLSVGLVGMEDALLLIRLSSVTLLSLRDVGDLCPQPTLRTKLGSNGANPHRSKLSSSKIPGHDPCGSS